MRRKNETGRQAKKAQYVLDDRSIDQYMLTKLKELCMKNICV